MNPLKLVAVMLVGSTLVAGCATSAPAAADGDNQASLLTRYTLGQCLAAAYPGTDIARDASAAAGGYLEFGDLPIEAYEEATALAKEAAARSYTGKHGEPLHAMKCLDLLDSAGLAELLERNIR